MMRTLICIGLLLVLGACTAPSTSPAPGTSVAALPETKDSERVLRMAYALKFFQYTNSEDAYREKLRASMEEALRDVAKRLAPSNPDELASSVRRSFMPEVDRRFPEVMDLMSGVFADVYTTDELRRASELVSSPSFLKAKTKQPMTEEDNREFAAFKPSEVLAALENKKAAVQELSKVRGEIWGRQLAEELYRRNPNAFKQKAI